MLKEFKDFIGGGNVMDLAVAVIVGAAMNKIIQSFVDELIVPLTGLIPGAGDLSSKYVVIKETNPIPAGMPIAEAHKNGVVLGYGQFISTGITVLLTAFVVFLIVRQMNAMKKKPNEAAEPAAVVNELSLLTEIRDALKK